MTVTRVAVVVALLAFVSSCNSEPTRIDVVVSVGGQPAMDELRAELGVYRTTSRIAEALELVVDDALDGRPQSLHVWGLVNGTEVAYGATTVTPVAHDVTVATVTLTLLSCTTSCNDGDVVCSGDGTTRCELQADGCFGWSTVEPCPTATPFCSNSTCSATCVDECTGAELTCAGGFATTTCGQFDTDSCRDWSVPESCGSGETCSKGVCDGGGCECDEPRPAPVCAGTTDLRVYDGPATCGVGTCSYGYTDRVCPGGCVDARCLGAWAVLPQANTPQARFAHSAVWTGTEVIIWGGATSSTQSLSSGARYNPATGAWTLISSVNAPAPRRSHSAVWTGTEMIVWGGSAITQGSPFADGGRYNPTTNTWAPMASPGGGRFGHSAVWTGTEMIVWGGGASSTASASDGARYVPSTDVWTGLPLTGAPGARRDHSAVWTGTQMIVWGGSTIAWGGGLHDDSAAFDPTTNTWTPTTSMTPKPGARFAHAAVWTDRELLIWGGASSSTQTYADGARLDPTTGEWLFLPTTNRPSARRQMPAVWTGTSMLSWGGTNIADDTGSAQMIELRIYGP